MKKGKNENRSPEIILISSDKILSDIKKKKHFTILHENKFQNMFKKDKRNHLFEINRNHLTFIKYNCERLKSVLKMF